MASRRNRDINLPAPYLKRIWIDPERIPDRAAYPFCLPFLDDNFSLDFDRAITIIVGENGAGKSTLLEGLAVMAGFDEAGGGKGYRTVDHSQAVEESGGELTVALRASWVPKVSYGWFFRAETFFRSRDIWTPSGVRRQISCPIRTVRGSFASSRSVANGKGSSFSTNRNRRCRHRARWNF